MRQRFAFTLHGAIYRLLLGAIVLAIVIPADMTGYHPMWQIAVIALLVVIVGIVVARQTHLRTWLRSR